MARKFLNKKVGTTARSCCAASLPSTLLEDWTQMDIVNQIVKKSRSRLAVGPPRTLLEIMVRLVLFVFVLALVMILVSKAMNRRIVAVVTMTMLWAVGPLVMLSTIAGGTGGAFLALVKPTAWVANAPFFGDS